MSLEFKQVYAVVKLIPKGMVMSYVGVARQCGYPRSARHVGHALFALIGDAADKVPWWRVVNAQGRISNSSTPDAPQRQRKRLEAEGVVVNDGLRVDMRLFDAEMLVYARLSAKRTQQMATKKPSRTTKSRGR